MIRTLLELPRPPAVYALVRKPLLLTHARLHCVRADFGNLAEAALPEADTVFCALGTTIAKAGSQEAFRLVDYEYPLRLSARMSDLGARQLCLVTSVGTAERSPNFYLRVKADLERDVNSLPFSGVHLFRPSFLTGERGEKRAGERMGIALAEALGFALIGGLRKYRAIPAATVARSMVAAAQSAKEGRFVYHYTDMMNLAKELSDR